MSKRTYRPLFLFVILTLSAVGLVNAQRSGDGLWREVNESASSMSSAERTVTPDNYRTFRLNKTMLRTILNSAPEEFADLHGISNTVITLPMPDGSFERFRIEHSLIVEPALLEKYPELGATYRGQGIDDPTASVRFDLLPSGFHSMILSPKGTVMVDPYSRDDSVNHISYYKRDVRRTTDFSCDLDAKNALDTLIRPKKPDFHELIPDAAAPEVTSGTQLRTYRLALAATNEYATSVGGNTVAGTLAAQVLIMNRVNGVYERDLSIRMVVIGTNNLIVYAGDNTSCGGVACTGANDPYTNTNGSTMLDQNIANTNTVITSANYDIGHVFSTGGGGIAGVGVPCGANKARGVTGLSNPVGDVFAIDFVAHEMGHQWGALHTFNGGTLNCSGSNRTAGSAYEPGSGITIMSYAGICGGQDLAGSSIDSFHVKSLEDIVAYSQTGNGNTCAATSATGNTPPTVASVGGTTFNIPKQTPFTLTASSSDANGDTVTYDWQQYDLGPVTTGIPNSDSDAARPIFRVFSPTTNPSRTFPRNEHILANANVPPNITAGFMTGELLPSIARNMTFQVIARDNRANGGGINTATVNVVVDGNGPFRVSEPNTNTTWFLNSNPTVTWDTAGSSGAPINAANVRILLSTDSGATFPTVLSASTPNDGSESVVSPAINTSNARIRIEPVGGIFFDVSDVDFAISSIAASNGLLAGRVTTAAGRGLARVYVVMTGGGLATPLVAITNAFGYYQFDLVQFGQSYTLTPAPRRGVTYTPSSIVRNHQAAATDVNFTAQ